MRIAEIGVVLLLLTAGCGSKSESAPAAERGDQPAASLAPDGDYDFGSPASSFALPDELAEISGLTVLSDGRVAAVQDEEGVVHVLNPQTGAVEERIPFAGAGDYEGIERVEERLFILKSNGDLVELTGWETGSPQVRTLETGLKGKNDTEGLAYDRSNNRLLIACKEDPGAGLDEDGRAVYAFDLAAETLGERPVIVLDGNAMKDRLSGKGQFRPSAVAVDPGSGEVYVLSSVLKGIAVVGSDGRIGSMLELSESTFEQPEGLAFSDSGELFIASEGVDGPGMLYRFRKRAQPHSAHE